VVRTEFRGDAGQVVPVAVALMGLLVVALLALVPAAAALGQRARAGTAADAAALAGAAGGEAEARRLAEANGGEVVTFERVGDEVVVRVRVGDVEAEARAQGRRRPPAGTVGGGGGGRAGLSPGLLAALDRADALLGFPVPVASGLRSYEEQQALWERRATNPYPVARPGTSDHERGRAVDVPRASVEAVLEVAEAAGLCQPLPVSDPVHFVACGE
jgi:hypothetical protein